MYNEIPSEPLKLENPSVPMLRWSHFVKRSELVVCYGLRAAAIVIHSLHCGPELRVECLGYAITLDGLKVNHEGPRGRLILPLDLDDSPGHNCSLRS